MSAPRAASSMTAYVGIGSNIADRQASLVEALRRLDELPCAAVAAVSGVYETAPVGVTDQPDFLNAVAALHVDCSAREFLRSALRIEDEMGRVRTVRWGPRNIDIDLLLFGAERHDEPDLIVPHPRLMERQFVLLPLAEIAPALVLPDGRTAREAADAAAPGVTRIGALIEETSR
jgi:2-amino-4-hydroxy-6-hydroxymethyldihydropteridine diphosphokinase